MKLEYLFHTAALDYWSLYEREASKIVHAKVRAANNGTAEEHIKQKNLALVYILLSVNAPVRL